MAKHEGKLDLNWAQVTGSSLAALSSAVLLSTLGATGTLIGAALGSLVVTVGGTLYSHYLSASRERVAVARQAALRRARVNGRGQSVPAGDPMRTGRQSVAWPETPQPTPTSAVSVSWRDAVRRVRWKPVLAVSAGVFVLVIGVIVSMELMTGRALSSYTGGTSADGPRTSISLAGSDRSSDSDDTSRSATSGDRSERDTDGRTNRHEPSSGEGTGSDDGSDSGDTDPTEQTDQTEQSEVGNGREPTTAPDSGTSEPTAEPEPEPTSEPASEPTPAPVEEPASEPSPAAPPSPAAGPLQSVS